MKVLFIILANLLLTQSLFATFNVESKGMMKKVSATEKEENDKATQKKYKELPPRLNLLSEMSDLEQKATGMNRLNKNQKAALSKWIENYCSQNQKRAERVKEKASPHAISAILGDGHYVRMGDGTVWNVSPNGWIYTYYWKAGEVVQATHGPDALFPFTLTNENYPLTVNAKKAASHIANSFKNEYYITDISSDGKIVTLSNGSKWEVPSSARYMVAGWADGSSVFITKVSKATGEHYEMFNGVTSRSAFVRKLSAGKSLNNNLKKMRTARNIAIVYEEEDPNQNPPAADTSENNYRSTHSREEEQTTSSD